MVSGTIRCGRRKRNNSSDYLRADTKLVELNEKLPELNFVPSTGAYIDGLGPENIRGMNQADMEAHMRRNIKEGYESFEETGVKAGIIKIGSKD